MTMNKLTWAQRKGMIARSTEKKFVNIKDAAEYLDVSRSTLRNWEKAGILVPRRHSVNTYRQYLKEDLDKLIVSKCREHIDAYAKASYGHQEELENLIVSKCMELIDVFAETTYEREKDLETLIVSKCMEQIGVYVKATYGREKDNQEVESNIDEQKGVQAPEVTPEVKKVDEQKGVQTPEVTEVKKDDNQLFNIRQAAEFFGVSPTTIKIWIEKKNITVLTNPDNNHAMLFRRELEEIVEKEKNENSTKKRVASDSF